jgi:hypothetical protein
METINASEFQKQPEEQLTRAIRLLDLPEETIRAMVDADLSHLPPE